MFSGSWLCHAGTWGGAAAWGPWGWVGLAAQALVWLAVLAGAAALLVWALRGARSAAAQTGSAPTAIQALQSEYARGLIRREQYLERLASLQGKST